MNEQPDFEEQAGGTARRSGHQVATGTVKFFNVTKGFGFIAPSDGAPDVFVHIRQLQEAKLDTFYEGQVVSYEVANVRGRLFAANLEIVDKLRATLAHKVEIVCDLPLPQIEAVKRPIEDLLARIKNDDGLLRLLTPEDFELFSLELLQQEGLQATLVSKWNQPDEGVDIIAIKRLGGGAQMTIAVQCKTKERNVDARPIRELVGVLDNFKAHKGIVMTTSLFTKPAIDEFERRYWKISLRDYHNILQSLRDLDLIKK